MEEDWILARFHQQVLKARDKSCHDRHVKKKTFKEGDIVLMYDRKSIQHPGKFRMNWLGPYEVKTITDGEFVQLKYLGSTKIIGMINEIQLKLYKDSRPPIT
jgi:hypothetical protein